MSVVAYEVKGKNGKVFVTASYNVAHKKGNIITKMLYVPFDTTYTQKTIEDYWKSHK